MRFDKVCIFFFSELVQTKKEPVEVSWGWREIWVVHYI